MQSFIQYLFILFLLCFGKGFMVQAQTVQPNDSSIFRFPIEMDEFVFSATKRGWDLNAFISIIQNDTTFYKAFKTLRIVNYNATNDIVLFHPKNEKRIAAYHSNTRQYISNNCRSMQTTNERVEGNFYNKKKDYNYYTAALYAYLFFTKDTVCGDNNIVAGENYSTRGKSQMEQSKAQLKQLIFNPGTKISGVPFMGKKASIFDEDNVHKYDFRISKANYENEACYLFRITPKEKYKNDVVYNNLETWLRISDYAILARNYSLSFSTWVYDFDVNMKVRLTTHNGMLLPTSIVYDGDWRIVSKGREKAIFTALFNY